MAQWRIKEISDLTKISVRMLHHYDKIGLLKPSVRASNGYRWYSERDLAKLQQILALKFFGFSLGQIKTMLQQKLSIQEHLQVQRQMLKEQTEQLRQAKDALDIVIQQYETSKSLDLNNLTTLIERYRMAEELKKSWLAKLNKKHQENFAKLEQKYPKEVDAYVKAMASIDNMLHEDPAGPEGEHIVKVVMDFMKVSRANWEANKQKDKNIPSMEEITNDIKEFMEKKIFTPEACLWLGKAVMAYNLKRWEKIYQNIDQNINQDPEGAIGKKIVQEWQEVCNEQLAYASGGYPELGLGTMLWQNTIERKNNIEDALQKVKTVEQQQAPATPISIQEAQEIAKKKHPALFFNPNAIFWITKALIKHKTN